MSNSDNTTESSTPRYEAVVRVSEAISVCREIENLASILADELSGFLPLDQLDLLVFKENSKEIEWQVWGKGPVLAPDVPIEELPAWHIYNSQEPFLITDWKKDERFPRLKQWMATIGLEPGTVLRVPLTTPHLRLGTL